jgi:hypothetical protein
MNKYVKLTLIILSIILLIGIVFKIIQNIKLNEELENVLEKGIKGDQYSQGTQDSNIINNNNDYLTLTEEDFDKLKVVDRWKYRIECLNHFPLFKTDYAHKEFIFPLPSKQKNGLIFVNLASYRDSECPNTIKSLITNCSNWKNLRITVCEQNSEEDKPFYHELNPMFKSIIKSINMSYKDARGPTWARFLIQQKYAGEQYYLQIDSHTLFEKDWDTKLINSLNELPSKSCLTQYLPDYEIGTTKTVPKLRTNLEVSRICSLDCFTRINANYGNPQEKYDKPFPSNGWSGCFSFSEGDICIDAPIDCYTPDVFFGEEMDISLRLYTRGWNFYAPNYPIAYTNFNRTYRETFWEKKGIGYNKNITLCSRLRFHYRFGTLPLYIRDKIEQEYPELLIDVDKFVLGKERTLYDYEKLIGFSIETESKIN